MGRERLTQNTPYKEPHPGGFFGAASLHAARHLPRHSPPSSCRNRDDDDSQPPPGSLREHHSALFEHVEAQEHARQEPRHSAEAAQGMEPPRHDLRAPLQVEHAEGAADRPTGVGPRLSHDPGGSLDRYPRPPSPWQAWDAQGTADLPSHPLDTPRSPQGHPPREFPSLSPEPPQPPPTPRSPLLGLPPLPHLPSLPPSLGGQGDAQGAAEPPTQPITSTPGTPGPSRSPLELPQIISTPLPPRGRGSAGRRHTSLPQLTARFATVVFLIVIHAGLIIWVSTLAVSYLYRAGGVLRTTTRPMLTLLLLRLLYPAARLHEH